MYKPLNSLLSPITLQSNEIHLWLISEQDVLAIDIVDEYLSLMSDDELKRMAEFKSAKRKQQYQITRAALRSIIGLYLPGIAWGDIRFATNRFGKPTLEDRSHSLHFNLSHSGGRIVIGVAAKQVLGVDIECINKKRDIFKIAEQYFCYKEWDTNLLPEDIDAERHFYKLWTLKEAFIKAEGKGFCVPLNQFYFDLSQPNAPTLIWRSTKLYSPKNWIFQHLFLEPNYSLAFALEDIGGDKAVELTARQYIPLHSFSLINVD